MTTAPNPIERLDVPLARLDADVRRVVARQRAAATPVQLLACLAGRRPVRADAAHLAAQRHLLVDMTPDSTVPEIVVSLIHPQRAGGMS